MQLADIIVIAVLAAITGVTIWYRIRKRKKGQSCGSCSSDCPYTKECGKE